MLHPAQKSEILIFNHLNERFLNTSGRLLCVGSHEQILESLLSRPVTHEFSNMAPVFTNHIIIIRSKKVRSPEGERGGPVQVSEHPLAIPHTFMSTHIKHPVCVPKCWQRRRAASFFSQPDISDIPGTYRTHRCCLCQ